MLFFSPLSIDVIVPQVCYPYNMEAQPKRQEVSADGHQLLIQNIDRNGSCMFLAVAHQLLGHPPGSREHQKATIMIRTVSVSYLLEHIDAPVFQLPLIGDMTDWHNIGEGLPQIQRFKLYAAKMLHTKMWGGAAALQSMAECFSLRIIIYQKHVKIHTVTPSNLEWKNDVHLFFGSSSGSGNVDHYDSILRVTCNTGDTHSI